MATGSLAQLDLSTIENVDFPVIKMQRVITASCRTFEHERQDVVDYFNSVKIYGGDFDVRVDIINRKKEPTISFECVAANAFCSRRNNTGTNNTINIKKGTFPKNANFACPPTPIDLIGDRASMTGLYWSWVEVSEAAGHKCSASEYNTVYGVTPSGEEYIFRVWNSVKGDAVSSDIPEITRQVLTEVDSWPHLVNGMTRFDFKERIEKDMDKLSALCDKYGTFGKAILPDAHGRITKVAVNSYDGNTTDVVFATEKFFYHMHFITS